MDKHKYFILDVILPPSSEFLYNFKLALNAGRNHLLHPERFQISSWSTVDVDIWAGEAWHLAIFTASPRADFIDCASSGLAVKEGAISVIRDRSGKAIATDNFNRLDLHIVPNTQKQALRKRENPTAFGLTAFNASPFGHYHLPSSRKNACMTATIASLCSGGIPKRTP